VPWPDDTPKQCPANKDPSWRFTPATSRALRRAPGAGALPASCFEAGRYYAIQRNYVLVLTKTSETLQEAANEFPKLVFSANLTAWTDHSMNARVEGDETDAPSKLYGKRIRAIRQILITARLLLREFKSYLSLSAKCSCGN
jgi:hypothetical protein